MSSEKLHFKEKELYLGSDSYSFLEVSRSFRVELVLESATDLDYVHVLVLALQCYSTSNSVTKFSSYYYCY